ncbi:MAG: GNAT family N-acetyltransferase [Candidatus Aminicenantes bacterium]|nr:GNAT family N-acetyltransferase [Candidatus Aminicenantes bacterium]
MENIKIESLRPGPDLEKLVKIQKAVWKHKDIDLTPVHHFHISIKTGSILLGVYVDGILAGFVYSFPAVFASKWAQHSHLLAVLPEYQGRKLGKMLKWAQRDRALELGYDLVTWTFDPLQSRNANLNLHTLGAEVKSYLPDFYGDTASLQIAQGLRTDRLFVEWKIKEDRVACLSGGEIKNRDTTELALALERSSLEDGPFHPSKPCLSLNAGRLGVEIPRDIFRFGSLPGIVGQWQNALKILLEHYLSRGYRGVDFVFGERCFYILEKRVMSGFKDKK